MGFEAILRLHGTRELQLAPQVDIVHLHVNAFYVREGANGRQLFEVEVVRFSSVSWHVSTREVRRHLCNTSSPWNTPSMVASSMADSPVSEPYDRPLESVSSAPDSLKTPSRPDLRRRIQIPHTPQESPVSVPLNDSGSSMFGNSSSTIQAEEIRTPRDPVPGTGRTTQRGYFSPRELQVDTEWWLWRIFSMEALSSLIEAILVVAGMYLIYADVSVRGFSTNSNSRFVSFIDSWANCYAFRAQTPMDPLKKTRSESWGTLQRRLSAAYHLGHSLHSTWGRVRVLVLSFLLKYGAGLVVSLLVWETPVFLKSPRHLLYFAGALALTHFSPGDVVFRKYQSSPWLQMVSAIAVSFYKLRKLLFVVNRFYGASLWGSWLPMLLLVTIALDGNALMRMTENALMHRGVHANNARALAVEAKRAWIVFWSRDFALLLCASGLYLAGATCASLKGTRGNAEAFACLLRNVAEVGALFVFFERTKLIRPTEPYHKGSLLWQSASGLVPKFQQWRLEVSRGAARVRSYLPRGRSQVEASETSKARPPAAKRESKED